MVRSFSWLQEWGNSQSNPAGDITGILAAGLADDFLALFVTDEPPKRQVKRKKTSADEL
jgi:hypothetical protein